ncbi:histidine phosphatase family protein [Pseudolysinimonas kribbensis]|uniref:Isomerase n=1 Tax=Pseudolysinimonas kribbensis TaxID=433641 RepID=A0ABQ6K7Q3_9MICO|nr:histidine phosphatase family protein [Pseudolysinimonas kribbensis]GMA96690.1 isomerase [Pseudolysinimonas kribbensis]
MRLLLIRHGQTPSNVIGSLDTAAPGPGLTALGLEQAAAVPTALQNEAVDGVYASILTRTRLTSLPLTRALDLPPARVLPGIHEIEAGELEQHTDRESVKRYMETAWAWGLGDLAPRMPGAGDGNAFFARFDESIAMIASTHRRRTAVAFSHAAAIRVWCAARAQNLPPEYAAFTALDNTAAVVLEGDPDAGWNVESWGGQPVGGLELQDPRADDVTGEPLDEAERIE